MNKNKSSPHFIPSCHQILASHRLEKPHDAIYPLRGSNKFMDIDVAVALKRCPHLQYIWHLPKAVGCQTLRLFRRVHATSCVGKHKKPFIPRASTARSVSSMSVLQAYQLESRVSRVPRWLPIHYRNLSLYFCDTSGWRTSLKAYSVSLCAQSVL